MSKKMPPRNDKRFLTKDKLFNMSIGELRNYHEVLADKYKKSSGKMKSSYKKQASIVKEIIDIKTGIKPVQDRKKSWIHNKGCVIPLCVFIISIVVVSLVSMISC